MTMNNVVCINCGYTYYGHTNVYGKVCIKCGSYIKPDKNKNDIESKAEQIKINAKNFIKDRIRRNIMPISEKTARMQIDFDYDIENLKILLRFHTTDEFGATISFLSENKEILFSLPVDLFKDVVNFLIDKNLINDTVVTNDISKKEVKHNKQVINFPNINKDSSLSKKQEKPVEKKLLEEEEFDISSINPVQSLGSTNLLHKGIQSDKKIIEETTIQSQPSVDEILAERAKAAANAEKAEHPVIKRS